MYIQTKRLVLALAIAVGAALAGIGGPAGAQTQIFADGFESGDTAAWFRTREQIPGSLTVNAAAAMNGSGLGLEVAAGGAAWVETRDADREKGVFVSFFFSENNWEMLVRARAEILRFNAQGRRDHLRLVLQRSPGGLRVGLLVRGNRGGYQLIGSGVVLPGENLIEVEWQAASTPNGTDGSATLWINGELEAREPTLANGRLDVRSMQLGLLGGNLAATRGSYYLDDFASFRTLAP
jgi:hypothetical protein